MGCPGLTLCFKHIIPVSLLDAPGTWECLWRRRGDRREGCSACILLCRPETRSAPGKEEPPGEWGLPALHTR